MMASSALTLRAPLLRFFLATVASILVLTGLWRLVAPQVAWPVGALTGVVLEQNFGQTWVEKVVQSPAGLEVQTRLLVQPSPAQLAQARAQAAATGQPMQNMVAQLTVDADPARYGYSFPLFVALMLVGRGARWFRRVLLGLVCLVPFQTFTVLMMVLRDAILYSGAARQTNFEPWQLNALAYGYQLGVLLLPTLVPIGLWLWLDRPFVENVLVRAWRERGSPR